MEGERRCRTEKGGPEGPPGAGTERDVSTKSGIAVPD